VEGIAPAGPDHVVVHNEVAAEVVQVDAIALGVVVDPVVSDDAALAVRPPAVDRPGVIVEHVAVVQVVVLQADALAAAMLNGVAPGPEDGAVLDSRPDGTAQVQSPAPAAEELASCTTQLSSALSSPPIVSAVVAP
jgi:hypothetical protein